MHSNYLEIKRFPIKFPTGDQFVDTVATEAGNSD